MTMLKVFWNNMGQILAHLPLTLSDSLDPKEVSQHRVNLFICLLFLLITPWWVLYWHTELWERYFQLWQGVAVFAGGELGLIMGKKALSKPNGNNPNGPNGTI